MRAGFRLCLVATCASCGDGIILELTDAPREPGRPLERARVEDLRFERPPEGWRVRYTCLTKSAADELMLCPACGEAYESRLSELNESFGACRSGDAGDLFP